MRTSRTPGTCTPRIFHHERPKENGLWSLVGDPLRRDRSGHGGYHESGPDRISGRAIPIVDVDAALADVTTRLVNRFEGQVPPDVVAATVRSCAERLQRARIVDFVPLLTERQSIERLRTLSS